MKKQNVKRIFALLFVFLLISALPSCETNKIGSEKTAYILSEKGDTYSLGLSHHFKTAFEAAGGSTVTDFFSAGTSDFSDFLQRAKALEPSVIFAPTSAAVAASLLRGAEDLGISVPILGGDSWESSVVCEAVRGSGLSVYCSAFFDPASNARAAEFCSDFVSWLEKNPRYETMNGGSAVSGVSALGFDGYNTALSAIRLAAAKKGEKMTSCDVASALFELDLQGVTGRIAFDEKGDVIKKEAVIKRICADGFEVVCTASAESAEWTAEASLPVFPEKGVSLDTAKQIITIGIFEPLSGIYASVGKQEMLGILYAHSLCSTVSIDGKEYRIVLYSSDNASLEENAAIAASDIVKKNALISLGSHNSGVSIAGNSAFAAVGIPSLGLSCTNPAVTDGKKFSFRICFTDPFQGKAMADFAVKKSNENREERAG